MIVHYVKSTFTSDFSEKMGSVCLIGTVLIIGMWEYAIHFKVNPYLLDIALHERYTDEVWPILI